MSFVAQTQGTNEADVSAGMHISRQPGPLQGGIQMVHMVDLIVAFDRLGVVGVKSNVKRKIVVSRWQRGFLLGTPVMQYYTRNLKLALASELSTFVWRISVRLKARKFVMSMERK